jgi:hypothetical protein
VLDFGCIALRVAVEADGGQHNKPGEHDWRDDFLAQRGWLILRFWNNEILANTDGVIAVINGFVSSERYWRRPLPNPPPRKRGRGGGNLPLPRSGGGLGRGCRQLPIRQLSIKPPQLNFRVVNPPVGISSLKQRW